MNTNIEFQPDLGESGWLGILPSRPPERALETNIEAEYCIVGAGFAGLSAARRILQLDSNAKVVILEASNVASGPAGRNSGFMIDLPHLLSSSSYAGQADNDQRDIRLNRNAIRFVRDMVEEYRLPEEVFRLEGKINASASQGGVKANQAYADHLDKLGEACNLLNAGDMQTIAGSDYYVGGLQTPGTAMIQPAMLIRGFSKGLVSNPRISLFERSPVVSLSKQADRWKISTPKGSVMTSKVILAVNGFIENFGFYQQRLMHINLYASMTRALSQDEVGQLGGEPRWGFTPSDPFGSTVRRISDTGGDRLIIRNHFSYDPSLKPDKNRLAQASRDHDKAFLARFPMLADVSMEYRWSGRLCLSRNHVWALGEVTDHVYSACCQNGLGTTKGVVAGVIAAEMACEQGSDSLMPDFRQEALPKKLLPEPLMTIGARTYLKIRDWRAGKDK